MSSQTLTDHLGYAPGTKLIIVHADDLGETHAVNAAAIKSLEAGSVNSASLMVPCPWFPEIADYAKSHPNADFGLHLTLTSERVYYRWGPVAPADKVSSLLDENGYFHHDWEQNQHVNPKDVEVELRAATRERSTWGSAWRQRDFDFFNSDQFRQILVKENIKLITWRELARTAARK